MKKRIGSLFLALCMCLTMLPTAALADEEISVQAATRQTVSYGIVDENTGKIKDNGNTRDSIVVDSTMTDWSSNLSAGDMNFYAVTKDVTISDDVTIQGKATLILCDGATLTINGSLTINNELYIYGQAPNNTGKLCIYNYNNTGAAIKSNSQTWLYMQGGNLTANGGIENVSLANGISSNSYMKCTLDGKELLASEWTEEKFRSCSSLSIGWCNHDTKDIECVSDDSSTHHKRCTRCGFKWQSENHDKATVPTGDGNTHGSGCKKCDYKSSSGEQHVWENGECKICHFKPVAVGKWSDLYGSVQAALAVAAKDTTYAELYSGVSDNTVVENQTIDFNYPYKTAELKMNGYALNNSSITVRDGTLNITGTTINISNSSDTAINVTGGKLIFNGKLTATGGNGQPAISVTGGTLKLKAGDVLNGGVSVGGSYTNVNALLDDGFAFAEKNGETTTIVDGSGKTITKSVTVVPHTEHEYVNGACACGAACPHSIIDDTTGECADCHNTFKAAVNGTLSSDMTQAIATWLTNGGTLKLYANGGTVNFILASPDKTYTIDLNGYSINKDQTAINLNGANLTIQDSREKTSSGGTFGPIKADSGTLTLENGGYLQELEVPSNSKVKIVLKDGKVHSLVCPKPVYNLLPDGYALMWGSLTVDPQKNPDSTKVYTVKDAQLTDKNTTTTGNTAFGSNTIPFALSLGTADREVGKMQFFWYYIDSNGTPVKLASSPDYVYPENNIYTFKAADATVFADGWNSMEAGKTYDVICVVAGKAKDELSSWKWQTALTGYKLTVDKASIENAVVTVADNLTYTGTEQSLKNVTVTLDGNPLELNKDYTITSGNTGTNAGNYTLKITGTGNYSGTATESWSIARAPLTVAVNGPVSKPYDGTDTANVDVTFTGLKNNEELTKGTDYTVVAKFDNASAGENKSVTGTVTLNENVKNYELNDNSISTTGTITKGKAPKKTTELYIANNLERTYTLDLALPYLDNDMMEYGNYRFKLGEIQVDSRYYQVGTAAIANGKLNIPIKTVDSKEEKQVGTIKVTLISDNIADCTWTIELRAVNRIVPTGTPTPSKTTLVYGEKLDTITLSGTMYDGTEVVAGTFKWDSSNTISKTGKQSMTWRFVPENYNKYMDATGTVEIEVTKATPTGEPKYTAITASGKKLSDARLTANTSWPDGTVKWVDDKGAEFSADTEVKANTAYRWVFTPKSENYNTISGSITLYRVSTSGGGGGSSTPTYPLNTPSKAENGSVSVSTKNAAKGSTVTITVKPDSGYVLAALTVTDKNGSKLTVTDKGNGKYTFVMPAGKVDISASFAKQTESSSFGDVSADDYFHDAVKWAQEKGITGGIGGGLFGPNQSCTRAQIVTFLWRAAGSPEPKSASGFADVPADSYYAKAVAWAVENGIANGMAADAFAPDASCTRAQSVTFLFRALGKLTSGKTAFSDVPAGSYYESAVAWATENGITNGVGGGLFGPDNGCTRAQIVTFLYRAYMGK